MANKHKDISPEKIINLAQDFVDECISATKQHATGSGKVVLIDERKIPTYKYFVMYWMKNKGIDFYERQSIYRIIKDNNHPLCDTLKNIRDYFDSIAEDIVANEGKGIFYAKNRLGMTDKVQSNETVVNVEVTPEEAKRIARDILDEI